MERTGNFDFEDSVEERIILTLLDLVNHLTRNGEEMAAEVGLTVQQLLTLLQIAGDPNFPGSAGSREPRVEGVLASEMAHDRGISRASVSSQVSALIRKRLVLQEEEPEDRRRKTLKITAAGTAALAAIEPARRAANRALFRPWSRRELEALHAILRDCLDRLAELRIRRRGETSVSLSSQVARVAAGSPGRGA